MKAEVRLPSEEELKQPTERGVRGVREPPLEVFRAQIEQWVEAGHSYVVMHQLIKERCPSSQATLRRFE